MKNNILKSILAIVLVSFGLNYSAVAEIAVVVNLENNSSFDANNIRKIFLGKTKSFSNGDFVQTFDLKDGNPARDEFRDVVLRKSESRLNSYWARMLFSSKAKPPRVLMDAEEVKAIVSKNPHAIAYIDSDDVDASVKVVLTAP